AELEKTAPNLTLEEAIQAARERIRKATGVLPEEGNAVYEEVIRGAQRSRAAVDKELGIERLGEPKLPSEVRGKPLPAKPNIKYTPPVAPAEAAAGAEAAKVAEGAKAAEAGTAAEAVKAAEAAKASRLSTLLGGAKSILRRVGG